MKKILALVLVAVMLLSLTACGEEKKLYEKYAALITSLELQNYPDAMNQVAGMAAAAQGADENRPEPAKAVAGDWYIYNTQKIDAPTKITIRENGTCSVDGKDMVWVAMHTDDRNVEAMIDDNGTNKYWFSFSTARDDGGMLTLALSSCGADSEGGIYPDKHIGSYLGHPMAKTMMVSWNKLDGDESLPRYFWLSNSMSYDDKSFTWNITSSAEEEPVTATAVAKDGSGLTYELSLVQRDGRYVMVVTDKESGAIALYCNNDSNLEGYGYEATWPEAIYPQLVNHLYNHLRNDYIWVENYERDLRGNAAKTYLYEQFAALGNYRDSADYLARFSTVPSKLTKVVQVTTDQLGNKSEETLEYYAYDEQGRMVEGRGEYMHETFGIYFSDTMYLEYGSNGLVSKITVGSGNYINAVCTPEYDAEGKLTAMLVQGKSGAYTSTFTYDDQGRLILVDIPDGLNYSSSRSYSYSYDDQGRLIQRVKTWSNGHYTLTGDYTYTGDTVSQIAEFYDNKSGTKYDYENLKVYEYDDQGRPLTMTFTTTNPDYGYTAREVVYHYEDLYFFNTDGLDLETDN